MWQFVRSVRKGLVLYVRKRLEELFLELFRKSCPVRRGICFCSVIVTLPGVVHTRSVSLIVSCRVGLMRCGAVWT